MLDVAFLTLLRGFRCHGFSFPSNAQHLIFLGMLNDRINQRKRPANTQCHNCIHEIKCQHESYECQSGCSSCFTSNNPLIDSKSVPTSTIDTLTRSFTRFILHFLRQQCSNVDSKLFTEPINFDWLIEQYVYSCFDTKFNSKTCFPFFDWRPNIHTWHLTKLFNNNRRNSNLRYGSIVQQ